MIFLNQLVYNTNNTMSLKPDKVETNNFQKVFPYITLEKPFVI